ncbi:hypothetical protein [Niallia sp. Krafla_26]|uniref:hypothetical protein n=1 Tax=Niallia sp. Krafla_26 TaxID=3064703 RepID=UPI003D187532
MSQNQHQKNRFTTPFGDHPGDLPVEPGRYRLIWSPHCPWAHRSVIVRKLLGLEDVISLGSVNPIRSEQGWEFSLDEHGVDPVLGIRYLSAVYFNSDPEFTGKATVPALVDIETKKVVNNDFSALPTLLGNGLGSFS